MKTYSEKLKDPRWQKKRLEVMERDGFTCRDCGATHKTLHVHHCMYEKGEPWETDSRFLLTLCEDCHDERGPQEADAKRALALLFARTDENFNLFDFVYGLVRATEMQTPMIIEEGEAIELWQKANREKEVLA